MATDKPRFSVTMEEELLDAVATYRVQNRIATQSKAVVRLVELGLDSLKEAGIIKSAPSLSDEAMNLAQDYDSLDSYGQRMVRMVMIEETIRCKEQKKDPAPITVYSENEKTEAVKQKAPIPGSEDGLEDSEGRLMDFVGDMNPGQQEKFYNQMHKLKEPQKESSTSASLQKVDDKAPKSESPDRS